MATKKKVKSKETYFYSFTGTSTVSVTTEVEATSLEEAREKVESGDCTWQCDDMDGDVEDIELAETEDPSVDDDDTELDVDEAAEELEGDDE